MIFKLKHIVSGSSSYFSECVKKAINELQNEGMTVEVQYSAVNTKDEYDYVVFTALLIGRKA